MSFVLRLRARGLADVAVLRALETVPRHLFVPHLYADLAWRDIALPIACGQTMSEPFTLARVMEALRVAPGHRVLEVGAGSGYATAILARLGAEVVSFERYRTLATEASVRLRELGFANARVIHGDGLAPPADIGVFDRIFIDGVIAGVPDAVMALLAADGAIVSGFAAGASPVVRRVAQEHDGRWSETSLFAAALEPLQPGVSVVY